MSYPSHKQFIGGKVETSKITSSTYIVHNQIITDTSTTRTLALTDIDKYIRFTSSSPITLTIPSNSSVSFPIGSNISFIVGGTGSVTITGSGVTINSSVNPITDQNITAKLVKTGTDEWDVDVSAGNSYFIDSVITDSSTSRTLSLSDVGKYIKFTGSDPITLTIPTNATVSFSLNSIITFYTAGTGDVTISHTGVMVNTSVNPITSQNTTVQMIKVGTDIWDVKVAPKKVQNNVVTDSIGGALDLTMKDENKYIRLASAIITSVYLGDNSILPYPVGTEIKLFRVGVLPAAIQCGDTMYFVAGKTSMSQYHSRTCKKIGTTEWAIY